MNIIEKVKNKIEQELSGSIVKVYDQSAGHVGHGSSGAHLEVEIVYEGFKKKSLIEQHQIIYKILQEEMKQEIHALKLNTKVNNNE